MADNENLLTQEQIDAMLAGAPISPEASDDAPVKLKPTSMDEIRAKSGSPLLKRTQSPAGGDSLEQLTQRIEQLEEKLQKQSADSTGQAQQELLTLASQVQALASKVDSIIASLQGTVGFGARETFVCRSCQSKGHVAARLNCTVCGEENWWGWWPTSQK